MKDVLVQLNDLPDEILMHILNKLHHAEVLFYLMDINQRFNRIVRDPVFTSKLCLLDHCPDDEATCPLSDEVLYRFCSQILPRIGHQIKTFCLEATSTERILQATDYPNLYELALYDIDVEVFEPLFVDKKSLFNIFKNQISSFSIKFTKPKDSSLMQPLYLSIFTDILSKFPNLKHLKFNPSSTYFDELRFDMSFGSFTSSALVELHVRAWNITDCLHLLDGRFAQLRALHVKITWFDVSSLLTEHKKKLLPNLQTFSLSGINKIYDFDESILLILHRMINLEELHLNIDVGCKFNFIDGNTLKKDITSYMSRLHEFTLNIYSTINHRHHTDFPLNESILNTFEFFYNNQLVTCVDHFQEAGFSQCRIYSYPYQSELYNHLTNHFPGGLLFNNVTEVWLYDEHPFEYEFFVRIARAFPFMKDLTVRNKKPQNDKQFIKSSSHNQSCSIIEYPNLVILDVWESHDDYVELFLVDSKVYLPNNIRLCADHRSLERVTYGYTRDATRNNCEKIDSLLLNRKVQVDECMKNYFLHAYIQYSLTII